MSNEEKKVIIHRWISTSLFSK